MKKFDGLARKSILWFLMLATLVLCVCAGLFSPHTAAYLAYAEDYEGEVPDAAYVYTIGDESILQNGDDVSFIKESETEYVYADFVTGYNAAIVKAKELQNQFNPRVKVVLAADWTAKSSDDVYSLPRFGEGIGFLDGSIQVPENTHIIFDLNGFVLDRAAADAVTTAYIPANAYGSVIYSKGELIVTDSNPDSEHDGLYAYGDGLELKGGIITGGYSTNGGGIYAAEYSALHLYGGSIYKNVVKSYTVEVLGELRTIGGCGGGVSVMRAVEFYMHGGNIIANQAYNGGGINLEIGYPISFYGGDISYNTAENYGGGIYNAAQTSLTDSETGIEYYNGVEIFDIKITHNYAGESGGGIYFTYGDLYLDGGEISYNSATKIGGVRGASTLYVEGDVKIQNNEGSNKNLCFEENGYLYVTKPLSEDAHIMLSGDLIKIEGYDRYHKDTETGYPIDPSKYFEVDDSASATCECHLVHGYYLKTDGTIDTSRGEDVSYWAVSAYYVEWRLYTIRQEYSEWWETKIINGEEKKVLHQEINEYEDEFATFDDAFAVEFEILDSEYDVLEYEEGVSIEEGGVVSSHLGYAMALYAIPYRIIVDGDRDYENKQSVNVYYGGNNINSNRAPVIENGKIVTSAKPSDYLGYIKYDENFWTIINVKTTPMDSDDIDIDISLTDEAVFGYKVVNNRLEHDLPAASTELVNVTVTDGGKVLDPDTDYTVEVNRVSEVYVVTVKGYGFYGGESKTEFVLPTNYDMNYSFEGWQFNTTPADRNALNWNDYIVDCTEESEAQVITYTGLDIAYRARMKLSVNGGNFGDSVDTTQYSYVALDGTMDYADYGFVYNIYKKANGAWEPVDRILNVGEYKIELNLEKSVPNIGADGLDNVPALYVTVVEKQIDFNDIKVNGEEGSIGDAVKAEYYNQLLNDYVVRDFLAVGDAYVDNGQVAFVTADHNFVYYTGNEYVLALHNLSIGGVDIDENSCDVSFGHSVTSTVGDGKNVVHIETTIVLTFTNYFDENGEHGITYTYNWAIVAACNGVTTADGSPYKPVEGNLSYGSTAEFNIPQAVYGNSVIVEFVKDSLYSKVVVVNSGGQITLYMYDENAQDYRGDKIEKDFASYMADIVREGSLGEYTLTVSAVDYKDPLTEIVYSAYPMTSTFKVEVHVISDDDETLSVSIYGPVYYTGNQAKPAITVVISNVLCIEGEDYEIAWGKNINAGKNAGEVVITGKGNYGGSVTVYFDINAVENNEWTVLRMSNWWYGSFDPSTNLIVSYALFGNDGATYTLEKYTSGDSDLEEVEGLSDFEVGADGVISDTTVLGLLKTLSPGKYRLTAYSAISGNYNRAVDYIDVSVFAAEYAVPSLVYLTQGAGKNDVYTGYTLSIAISDFNTAGMNVTVGDGLTLEGNILYAKLAGTYTVTFTLTDEENSSWSDGEGISRTLEWVIAKQTVALPDYGVTTYTYNGKEVVYMPEGFDADVMVITGNSATEAGLYEVHISLKDPDNYRWESDEYGTVITHTFRIETSMRLFIIIITILTVLIVLAAIIALTQFLMHKQRLQILGMAADAARENAEGDKE